MIKLNELLRKMKLVEYSADEIYDGDNPYLEPNPEYEGDTEKSASSGEGGDSGSEAAEQAHKLNLVSKGWGRWADQSGKIVAKTVQGKLVKIDEPSVDDYAETGGTADDYIKHHPELAKKHGINGSEQKPDMSLSGNVVNMVQQKAATPDGQFSASADDYFGTPEKVHRSPSGKESRSWMRDLPKAEALVSKVKETGGARAALSKISPKHRGEFAKLMKIMAADELDNSFNESNIKTGKDINALFNLAEDDLSDFDEPVDLGQYEHFELSADVDAQAADVTWLAANAAKNGQNPEELPEFQKAMKSLAYDINHEVDQYNSDVRYDARENDRRYIRRPYDRF